MSGDGRTTRKGVAFFCQVMGVGEWKKVANYLTNVRTEFPETGAVAMQIKVENHFPLG